MRLFPLSAPDPEWLRAVGERGWVVVTRDRRIRNRANELAAVRRACMHVFALTSGNLSAAAAAESRSRCLAGGATRSRRDSPADAVVDREGATVRQIKR